MCQDLAQTLFSSVAIEIKRLYRDLNVLVSYHNGLYILTYFFD